ncbi:MAG: hypothetical protein GX409_03805 [candidate division Zixibacteria bacterium]|nr:hypothetical protein [candidate division Zixibacteria bacterium]
MSIKIICRNFKRGIWGRIMAITLSIFFSAIHLYANCYANAPEDSVSKRIDYIRKTIIGRYGLRFELDKNGIPISITGDLYKGAKSSDPIEQAYQFFDFNRDIFPIKDAKTELRVMQHIGGDESFGPTVKLAWSVNGIIVDGSEIILNYSRDNKLYSYYGRFFPEALAINTDPVISQNEAEQTALRDSIVTATQDLNDTAASIHLATLIIARFDGKMILTWYVSVIKGVGNSWGFWIDAQTGRILKSGSLIIN